MGYVDYNEHTYFNPLKSVTHHRSTERDVLLKHQIRRIIRLGVCEKANMSLKEVLQLDLGFYDYLLDIIEDDNREDNSRQEDLEKQVADLTAQIREEKKK